MIVLIQQKSIFARFTFNQNRYLMRQNLESYVSPLPHKSSCADRVVTIGDSIKHRVHDDRRVLLNYVVL